jgi:hypothetical protein
MPSHLQRRHPSRQGPYLAPAYYALARLPARWRARWRAATAASTAAPATTATATATAGHDDLAAPSHARQLQPRPSAPPAALPLVPPRVTAARLAATCAARQRCARAWASVGRACT